MLFLIVFVVSTIAHVVATPWRVVAVIFVVAAVFVAAVFAKSVNSNLKVECHWRAQAEGRQAIRGHSERKARTPSHRCRHSHS